MAGQLAACEDYQTVADMLGNRSEAQKIKNFAQCLEDKLEGVQQQYKKEKQQTSQLQEALRELAQICESRRNDIMQLKGELEAAEKQAALQRRDHECWLPVAVGWRQDQGDEDSSEPAVMRKLHWLKDLKKILIPLRSLWCTCVLCTTLSRIISLLTFFCSYLVNMTPTRLWSSYLNILSFILKGNGLFPN